LVLNWGILIETTSSGISYAVYYKVFTMARWEDDTQGLKRKIYLGGGVQTPAGLLKVYFTFQTLCLIFTPCQGKHTIVHSIRYSRACGSYQDFIDRRLLLTRKLQNQGFPLDKLKSSLRKFYDPHHDLIDRYGIVVSQMTTDMFHLWKTSRSFSHSWLITGFV